MSRAIFFDLAGTLTDSGPGIINCAQLALAHFGIQVPDRDQLRVFVGPPLRQSFARFGVPPASLDEAIARFRARYVPIGKFENTPYPGIAGLLDRLQGAGYRLFVATSKPQVTAQEVLEHFQLARYFERVCGASLDAGRETKEDVISYLLAQIGDPGQVVMVGDTAFDVLGAKVHGIPWRILRNNWRPGSIPRASFLRRRPRHFLKKAGPRRARGPAFSTICATILLFSGPGKPLAGFRNIAPEGGHPGKSPEKQHAQQIAYHRLSNANPEGVGCKQGGELGGEAHLVPGQHPPGQNHAAQHRGQRRQPRVVGPLGEPCRQKRARRADEDIQRTVRTH